MEIINPETTACLNSSRVQTPKSTLSHSLSDACHLNRAAQTGSCKDKHVGYGNSAWQRNW
jgi:hypothetical protein